MLYFIIVEAKKTERHCKKCNKELDALLPFQCRHCKQYFCENHRLPELHSCPSIKISNDIWENRKKKLLGLSIIQKEDISLKTEKILLESDEKDDKTLSKICSFCSIKSIYLWKCQYCNKWFCKDHIKPKKPEEIGYLKTPGGHSCKPYIESIAPQKEQIGKVKRPLYKHPNKLISWFFWKKHPHSKLRKKNFYKQLTILSIVSLLLIGVFSNLQYLNTIIYGIFKLGAILIMCLIIIFAYVFYKFLINLRYGIRGRTNGFKLTTSIIILLCLLFVLLNTNFIGHPISEYDYSSINPITDTVGNVDWGIKSPFQPEINTTELALDIHNLINIERQKYGLSPLIYDLELGEIALAHSQDMATRGYFSHDNLGGDGPTERAIKAGYTVHKELGGGWYSDGIAENIFQNNLYSSVTYINGIPMHDWNDQNEIALSTVFGWMNSPGHRQNILDSSYDKEGIGVAVSSDNKVYITQDFW